MDFLPVCIEDLEKIGQKECDFVMVTGDAYVDHPSFGAVIIARLLQSLGYVVGMVAQPDFKTLDDFKRFGRPKIGFMVTSGSIDSMVSNYTASKKVRSNDDYSPGGKGFLRPDRAVIVYCNKIREAYGDIPIIIGGLEASLRRFAHYDYWSDKVRRSIICDTQADLLIYGMGEKQIIEMGRRLKAGQGIKEMTDIKGTTVISKEALQASSEIVYCQPFEVVKDDKKAYAKSFKIQYDNHDPVTGKTVVQKHDKVYVVQNPPMPPLSTEEMDMVYALPYMRAYHPKYKEQGGVPAINEVEFSITLSRGCFGGCNFCSLAFHQGRMISTRSQESVINEAKGFVKNPDFKGYISDVGGPTANFTTLSCKKQKEHGMCKDKKCLAPEPCPNLIVTHRWYDELLYKLRNIEGIKKVFIRSGIRYDYLMLDEDNRFFEDLVKHHISGQLKVAPEHCSKRVLNAMGKPSFSVYEKFYDKYFELNKKYNKNQFLVPYLMSSHPGSKIEDAIQLAQYLNKIGYTPEQVQDFYPTPGTISTAAYYTGIDPLTNNEIYVAKDYKEKAMQRALLQFKRPQNRELVLAALKSAKRQDLIGSKKGCLVSDDKKPIKTWQETNKKRQKKTK